jgi:riboflavin synthase
MFTGLIDRIGTLERVEIRGNGARLSVGCEPWPEAVTCGESISVQGVCLTAAEVGEGRLEFDILRETLDRSSLGVIKPGARVNLERALRADDRMGGHFVYGHVDGMGRVMAVVKTGEDRIVEIRCAVEILEMMVPKGSIACDGVSLTVGVMRSESFSVFVIPTTWQKTSFGSIGRGDPVNLECDVIGKYVKKYVSSGSLSVGVTLDTLRNAGFPV